MATETSGFYRCINHFAVVQAGLLGQRLSARDFDRQVAEFQIRVAVLKGFTDLGTPSTEAKG